jgi:uncharacterized membrane protein YczE
MTTDVSFLFDIFTLMMPSYNRRKGYTYAFFFVAIVLVGLGIAILLDQYHL